MPSLGPLEVQRHRSLRLQEHAVSFVQGRGAALGWFRPEERDKELCSDGSPGFPCQLGRSYIVVKVSRREEMETLGARVVVSLEFSRM